MEDIPLPNAPDIPVPSDIRVPSDVRVVSNILVSPDIPVFWFGVISSNAPSIPWPALP